MVRMSAITIEESKAALEEFNKEVLAPLEAPSELSVEQQLEMYRKMAVIRVFDTRVKELWKQNFIYGLAHSYVCAEAIAVGIAEGDETHAQQFHASWRLGVDFLAARDRVPEIDVHRCPPYTRPTCGCAKLNRPAALPLTRILHYIECIRSSNRTD